MINEQEKKDIIAEAVIVFWGESYPVLVNMVAEMLPSQIELMAYLKEHPEHNHPGFLMAAIDAKKKTPNAPLVELLEEARKAIEPPGVSSG